MSRQPGLLTSEEFAALHVEGVRLELIRGELCVMPPAFADHGETVGALHAILGAYVRTYNLGKMYSAETGFLVARNPDSIRTTDIAFIQRNRLTPEAVAPNWNPVMPDLVVEVVASRDRARNRRESGGVDRSGCADGLGCLSNTPDGRDLPATSPDAAGQRARTVDRHRCDTGFLHPSRRDFRGIGGRLKPRLKGLPLAGHKTCLRRFLSAPASAAIVGTRLVPLLLAGEGDRG